MNDSHSKKTKPRKFTKLRGYPGIFRVWVWNVERKKYVDPRGISSVRAKPFRALRRVRILGKQVQQCAHFDSLEEARIWRNDPHPEIQQAKKSSYTVKDLIEEWLEWSKPPRKQLSTWQTNAAKLKHFQFLHEVPVEDLEVDDIDRWLAYVRSDAYPKGATRTSFIKELQVFRAALYWYRDHKNSRFHMPILERHRNDSVVKEKPLAADMPLTLEQLERFLTRLKKWQKPVYYYLASFQAFSGARIGEACGLRWDCVDLAEGLVQIKRVCVWDHKKRNPNLREGTKTGQGRTILIPPRLIDVLKEWREMNVECDHVFHKNGKLLHYPAIQNAYKKAYRHVGLPVRSTHVLRHTFGTLHAHQTKNIRATQAALGHRDLRVTQLYAKVSIETQRQALGDFTAGKSVNGNGSKASRDGYTESSDSKKESQ